MNATPREREIASQLYVSMCKESLSEPFNPASVLALLAAAASVTTDKDVHVKGDEFGKSFYELIREYEADHSSETDGGQR